MGGSQIFMGRDGSVNGLMVIVGGFGSLSVISLWLLID